MLRQERQVDGLGDRAEADQADSERTIAVSQLRLPTVLFAANSGEIRHRGNVCTEPQHESSTL
jgi:hypothetical protein